MHDVITIFSSPAAASDPRPRVDLGLIEITDSEPEDFGNDDFVWTPSKKKDSLPRIPLHRNRDNVKEDSPMDVDVDVPTTQAGPSAPSLIPESFPRSPAIYTEPWPEPQTMQGPDTDPYSAYLALILEFIPDVLPKYATELIEMHHPAYGDQVVERVLQDLFDDPYPKDEKGATGKWKAKRKASEMEDVLARPPSRVKVDFGSVDRSKPTGKNYPKLALNQLFSDFPYVPVSHIRRVFASNGGLYAPTHIQLTTETESDMPPFTMKAVKTKIPMGKGKERERQDKDFEEEKAWLLLKDIPVTQEISVANQPLQNQVPGGVETFVTNPDVPPEEDGGLECGCCFSPVPFQNMIQCPDAHLFCMECMVAYASNLLGEHNVKLVCIDQSGCKLLFPESELERFLTPKLLALYEKVKQAKEIEMAGLDGLEECPHCEFKAVIDNPNERLFRCQNEECGAVTCRECKKPDHLPKSCAEVDEDKKIDARHVVEEAMTNALLRNCPKCNKVFIKESGCNKMACPNCMTLSCYVCRKVINGYDHFNEARAGQPQRAENAGKCLLWDKVEERHQKEVEEAQKKAITEYRKEHPEMGEDALHVELPEVTTGEAGGSRNPRPRPRPVPLYDPIEPLRLAHGPEPDRHRRLFEAIHQARVANAPQKAPPELEIPEGQLPRLEPNVPPLRPFRLGRYDQYLRDAQEALQPHGEDLQRRQEDIWIQQRRLAQQQRVLAGRFAGNNLRNQRPAALPDVPVRPIPRPRGNRAGGAGMDPTDRGRVDQWRRGVPARGLGGPEEGATL